MSTSSPWVQPQWGHGLTMAIRFVDAFTGATVAPGSLDVRVEAFPYVPGVLPAPWIARPGSGDVCHFVVADRHVAPTGPMTISVSDKRGRYASYEPLVVSLPRPLVAHPPSPAASDFLVEAPLWPTTVFRAPASETSVTGVVRSAGALASVSGMRVMISRVGDPPGPAYGYTDAAGGFVVRLVTPAFAPEIPVPPPPGDPWPPQIREVFVTVLAPPLFAAPLVVTALRRDGAIVASPFDLDLGRNSLLDVTVA